jgi:hypothetical protein
MANVLIIPASGVVAFDSTTAGTTVLSPLSSGSRLSYDNGGGINITSYMTAASAINRLTIDGTQGRLFSVTDNLTGSLMSVNDIAGLPILEVFDTPAVVMGSFNTNTLVVSGTKVGIGTNNPTNPLTVSGNMNATGNIYVGTSCSGATSTPAYVHTGNNFSNGVTDSSLKYYLYCGGSGANYGFTVGSTADVQYHTGSSSGCHNFYVNNTKIACITPNGIVGSLLGSSQCVASNDGDRNAATKALPTTTGHAVRFDFANASSTGNPGSNYAGVMTYAPSEGTTASTGDASYQLAFGSTCCNGSGIPVLNIRNGIDSTWNGWHTIIHRDICNVSNGKCATITGGYNNTASGTYSVVGGGKNNNASGSCSSIGGGYNNTVCNSFSNVAGGSCNTAFGNYSNVAGGNCNTACGAGSAFVGGGSVNKATNGNSAVAGGAFNCSTSTGAFVGGGYYNTASGYNSNVAGGRNNTASGYISNVSGGNNNTASGCFSNVAGGSNNTASGYYNSSLCAYIGSFSTIGGGSNNNTNNSSYSVIAGGSYNVACGLYSNVAGGYGNIACGYYSNVAGGYGNIACGYYSNVAGGASNIACGNNSNVAGGRSNNASGNYSSILGGQNNYTNSKTNTFILGSNITALSANYTYVNNISSQGLVYDGTGNSNQWNSAYNTSTAYQSASSSFITAVSGTANQINASKTGSTVTLSFPNSAVFPGDVSIIGNLTNATGYISASALKITSAPTTFTNPVTASGSFLIVNINGTNKAIQLWDYTS